MSGRVHPETVVVTKHLDPTSSVVRPGQARRSNALARDPDGGVRDGVRMVGPAMVVVDSTVDLAVLDGDVIGPNEQVTRDVLVVDHGAGCADCVRVTVLV